MIHIKITKRKEDFLQAMKNKKFIFDGKSRPSTNLYKENFNRIFNPTLTKNMPNVKWKEIPPVKGPNSQGLNVPVKQVKTIENSRKINGRHRQSST